MGVKINAADMEETQKPVGKGQAITISASDVEGGDKGPEGRRAEAGLAPTPRSLQGLSDAELGAASGPQGPLRVIPVSPMAQRLLPDTFSTLNPIPSTEGERLEANKASEIFDAGQSAQSGARTLAALGASGPVAAGGKALGAAIGAGPKMANVIAGAVAGGTGAATTSGNITDVPKGAAFGAALSGGSELMKFIVGRAMAPGIANEFARKGAAVADKATGKIKLPGLPPETTMQDVANVVEEYGINSVKRPQVAKEAIEASIARASKASEAAWDVVRTNGTKVKSELVTQAFNAMNKANKDVAILRKLLPVANKMVAKDAIKPTMLENIATGAKRMVPYAIGAGAAQALFGNNGHSNPNSSQPPAK